MYNSVLSVYLTKGLISAIIVEQNSQGEKKIIYGNYPKFEFRANRINLMVFNFGWISNTLEIICLWLKKKELILKLIQKWCLFVFVFSKRFGTSCFVNYSYCTIDYQEKECSKTEKWQ